MIAFIIAAGLPSSAWAGPSNTTLSVNPGVVNVGVPVTFTATVTGAAPTGSVVFNFGDGPSSASVPLSGGTATTSHTYTTVGFFSAVANYLGDGNNASSSGNDQVQVRATTTTAVSFSPNPSVFGQSVTVTATVTSGGGTPTGTVTFTGGGINTDVNVTGGVAILTTSALGVGLDSITARYNGNVNFLVSSAVSSQQVNHANTSTSLASTANPSVSGQSVTFTATVAPVAPGAGTPTGTVQFKDGAANLGAPVNLSLGAATFSTNTLTQAGHNIAAVYSGDTNFTSSTGALTLQVNQTTSTTTLTSSLNPSAAGQNVTLTATVTAVAPGTGTPTGTVQFKDGAANLGAPVNLSSGVASFSTKALTQGGHTISAVYSGDTNNVTSTATLTQTVNASATTTALVSSLNPSATGQAVTFTATVTSAGGTPAGTVNFLDGSTVIGSAALAGGVASFTLSTLTSGKHTITASYGGGGVFTASTSSAVIQAVSVPSDSLKLRALQVLVTPTVAQVSGQAISGAIDSAIGEGFSEGGGALVTPSGSGVRFNFSADPDATVSNSAPRAADPFSSANGSFAAGGRGPGSPSWASRTDGTPASASRVDDAFGALGYAAPTKAPPPRYVDRANGSAGRKCAARRSIIGAPAPAWAARCRARRCSTAARST
jgi:hypothetical protein